MIAQNQRREAQLAKSTRVIWWGVAITAFGSFLQVTGGIGQAVRHCEWMVEWSSADNDYPD